MRALMSTRLRRGLYAVVAGACLAPALAPAAFVRVEDAYELRVQQLRLPDSASGSLYVQPCDGCRRTSLRVDGHTQWRVGARGQPLTLAEFRGQWSRALASAGKPMVFVYYRPKDGVVNRVVLSLPRGGAE